MAPSQATKMSSGGSSACLLMEFGCFGWEDTEHPVHTSIWHFYAILLEMLGWSNQCGWSKHLPGSSNGCPREVQRRGAGSFGDPLE